MPTYEYRCTACDEHVEVVQSFSDEPLTKCPKCGKKALRKVFSPVGIVFKGSGFYKTDSRGTGKATSPKPKEKETSSSSDSSSSSGSSSSSDSSSSSSSNSSSDSSSSSSDSKKDSTKKKDSKIA
ncbi:MAG TPA: FmdB family zinc ribbon protein [Acidimicrobiia bacterium]|nr:FmdB family zinc ribbon protein [Acidimicrobiia bacterium]